ncbi:hypothetical protein COOONC_15736 [Cooperia oncophora]
MKRIAGDIGVDFDKTNAPPDILAVVDFTEKLHQIPVPDLKDLLEDNDYFNSSDFQNLSVVERTAYKHQQKLHDYIRSDPPVSRPSDEYMKRMDELLNRTSPRTITNYVIVQYILAWLPLLGKSYYSLVQV